LLSALRARNVDAQLVILVEPDNLMTEMVVEAEKRSIPVQRVMIRFDLDPGVMWRLRRVLRDLKPDVVHTHLIHADLLGLAAARLAGVKTVLTGRHNDDEFRYHRVVRALNKTLWRGFTGGIAISEAIKNFTINIEGAPPPKVRVVAYGFEYVTPEPGELAAAQSWLRSYLGVPEDALLMGIACRLVDQKGVTYALQGFKQVTEDFPQARLVIAGEGELRAVLEAEATALGIAGRTHFLGWQSNVPHVLAGVDIFLMPSLWEGFGLVLLEAMSKRLPVIASAVSAIPEIVVHGESGILVPPKDATALAEAMRLLLPDRSLRAYMGLNGEDRLDRLFSAGRMADETIVVYREFSK
jgi:glycosyltransferase involved in cell wall biosynthesis